MDKNKIVEVENLHVSFSLSDNVTVDAVKGVSFHIDQGETLALVGESGSGKSVTAMTIMRLPEHDGARINEGAIHLRLRSGEIVDIVKLPISRMNDIRGADVSIVFQDPMASLNPVFTVGHQIAEAIIIHQGKSPKQAEEIAFNTLQLVRVPDAERRMKQYPHQLSGGMRQRVVIAMALSCRPVLLIADEPSTALDVTIQAQILNLIRALQKEIVMSVLFITHDMGVVAEIADRVCVMQKGRFVETGSVYDIFENPQHPYTRALISAVPKLGSMTDKDKPEKFPILEFEED
ncbi:MAG: ABC transporter ATP-binding protein [SAR324 cluster bacterium]|nr:ABC transporter ATP-binding protein [SAR324 cluster bacterium]